MTNIPPKESLPAHPHKDYYQALYQAALTISSSLELEQVLQSITMSVTQAMQVQACALRLLDPESGQLYLSAAYGLSENYLAKGPVNAVKSSIDSEALQGTAVYIEDAQTDPRIQYQEAMIHEGLVSILCVPLEVRGEAIGVIRVYTKMPVRFAEDDIQFLSTLASLAALALENARLYDSIKNSYSNVMSALWGEQIFL
jgi:GAF domain-containing protein